MEHYVWLALAATLGFAGANLAWQTVFWVGGVVPLILVPLLMRWLPESQAFQRVETSVPLRTLFAPGHAAATLLLWLGYFFVFFFQIFQLRLQRSNILHSAGGLHVDQLATATFGGARIPAIAGGRGDVCPANGGGKRDVNVGRIDG